MRDDAVPSTVRTCSFCGTEEARVAGSSRDATASCDNQCIDLCNDILNEEEDPDVPRGSSDADALSCSACGADGASVAKLIAARPPFFICGGCVRRFAAELPPDRPRWRLPLALRVIEVILRIALGPLWWLRRAVTHALGRARPDR